MSPITIKSIAACLAILFFGGATYLYMNSYAVTEKSSICHMYYIDGNGSEKCKEKEPYDGVCYLSFPGPCP